MRINFKVLMFVFFVSLSLITKVQAYCFEEAGQRYSVSPLLLYAISSVESSFNVRAINVNTNGSEDRGHMQINSFWKKYLGDSGWDSLYDPCYCTNVGAWIVADCIARYGNNWDAVACYHCGHSPADLPEERRPEAYRYIDRVQEKLNELTTERAGQGRW